MKRYSTGIILAIIVFLIQVALVSRVGVSWDEPASFFVGRANLKFWMTGNRAYLNDLKNRELFADSPIQYIYGEDIYPPFPFLISSAVSYLFAEKLQIINILDAHHIGEIFIGSIGVFALFGLSLEAGLPVSAAAAAAVTYALFPSIWGPMRNDAKDIPLVSILTVAAFCYVRFLRVFTAKRFGAAAIWSVLFAVALGISGATKPTAIILVPVLGIWIAAGAARNAGFRRLFRPVKRMVFQHGLLAVLSLSVFLLMWPWLWDNPIGKLTEVFSFFRTVGYNMPTPYMGTIYRAGINLPPYYAFAILFLQSPPELTILFIAGVIYGLFRFFRRSDVWPMLFIVWFAVSMGRFLIPGMIIYAWVRHFIDAMPAYFVLIGYGVHAAVLSIRSLARRIGNERVLNIVSPRVLYGVFIGIVVIHQGIISFIFFPFESSYFNMFVGGTKHVAKLALFDVGQGAGVKEAMEAIVNDANGKPVKVYSCAMAHLARFYVADNVTITTNTGEAQYTIVPNSVSWFGGALDFNRANHHILHAVNRGGADLFYAFKYSYPNGWRCGWETVTNYTYE